MAVINQSFEKFQNENPTQKTLKQSGSSIKMITENSNNMPFGSSFSEDPTTIKRFKNLVYKTSLKKPEFNTCFLNFRNKLCKMFESQVYLAFVTIVILMNTIFLTLDRYPTPSDLLNLLNYSNICFTIFFFVEMILKIVAFKPSVYLKDKMNIFDIFIVWASVLDIILEYAIVRNGDGEFSGISSLSALRTFRLFRMFKILRAWKDLKNLIQALIESLISLKYFSVLLLIFMIIATFLGNELFAYRIRFINDYQIAPDK